MTLEGLVNDSYNSNSITNDYKTANKNGLGKTNNNAWCTDIAHAEFCAFDSCCLAVG